MTVSDPARVDARAALAGLLLSAGIGAVALAVLSAATDPDAGRFYLSIVFVGIAFCVGVVFAGPLGVIAAVGTALLAIRWRRRGRGRRWIRGAMIPTGLAVGALSGGALFWVVRRSWFLGHAGPYEATWWWFCVGTGALTGAVWGISSLRLLGPAFERITPAGGAGLNAPASP